MCTTREACFGRAPATTALLLSHVSPPARFLNLTRPRRHLGRDSGPTARSDRCQFYSFASFQNSVRSGSAVRVGLGHMAGSVPFPPAEGRPGVDARATGTAYLPVLANSCASLLFFSRLALYVYEYLLHVGAQKAAQTFLSEVSRTSLGHLLFFARPLHG